MGSAYPGLFYPMSNALAGVYSYKKSRQAIWDGLHDRRTFAVTGNQRMLVDFEVNGEKMGGEISSGFENPPAFEPIHVAQPLAELQQKLYHSERFPTPRDKQESACTDTSQPAAASRTTPSRSGLRNLEWVTPIRLSRSLPIPES